MTQANPKILQNVRLIQKCILINKEDKVLALKRAADDISRGGNWDLPGGGYEKDEVVEEAIRREVLEEAGVRLNSFQPVYFTNRIHIDKGFFAGLNVFGMCYCSTDWEGEPAISEEHTEMKWVTPEEFLELDFGEDSGFFSSAMKAYIALPH